jgi:dolichol kinase
MDDSIIDSNITLKPSTLEVIISVPINININTNVTNNSSHSNNNPIDSLIKYSSSIWWTTLLFLTTSGSILLWFSYDYKLQSGRLFWINQGLKYLVIAVIQYMCSLAVIHRNIKVNYTRKIVHISYFIWPQILDRILINYDKNIYSELWNIYIILLLLFVISEPVRNRFRIIDTMYRSVDRPEDRPYTLVWFSTQIIATLAVFLPFVVYFNNRGQDRLLYIPILINGIGDGLAEPVGIRFGKHKYTTRSFLSDREYTRSYEGSLCVFTVSLIIILSYYDEFSQHQYIYCVATIPIMSTLVEAYSPHTWDSPLIYLTVLTLLIAGNYI